MVSDSGGPSIGQDVIVGQVGQRGLYGVQMVKVVEVIRVVQVVNWSRLNVDKVATSQGGPGGQP